MLLQRRSVVAVLLSALLFTQCGGAPNSDAQNQQSALSNTSATTGSSASMPSSDSSSSNPAQPGTSQSVATFGAGCYWCVEAVLEQLDGVSDVVAGFMGGHVVDPSYAAVCDGTTGHAEVVQVHFDPAVITFEELCVWFWKLHDPTTLNRQGNDYGTQYRSAIYYHSDEQQRIATASMRAADASGAFSDPIVTEITAADTFYVAKQDHQDYYRNNRTAGYCRAVISPKLDKLKLQK